VVAESPVGREQPLLVPAPVTQRAEEVGSLIVVDTVDLPACAQK
jgi:hypothetical protein